MLHVSGSSTLQEAEKGQSEFFWIATEYTTNHQRYTSEVWHCWLKKGYKRWKESIKLLLNDIKSNANATRLLMQLLDWTVTRDCVTSDTALVFKLGSALYTFSLSFGTLWALNPAWLQNPGLGINNANHDGGIITFDNCLIRATWFSSIQIVLPTDPHHIFANRD
jgi:hypothetical protein